MKYNDRSNKMVYDKLSRLRLEDRRDNNMTQSIPSRYKYHLTTIPFQRNVHILKRGRNIEINFANTCFVFGKHLVLGRL